MVSLSTVRSDVYTTLRTLIDTNKVSGTTIVNSFPEANPVFPCVVMPMADVGFTGATSIDGSKRVYEVVVEFGFWATALSGQGQLKVAQMMDNLQSTLEANQASLLTSNLALISFSPSSVERVDVNEQKLYTAGAMLVFEVLA